MYANEEEELDRKEGELLVDEKPEDNQPINLAEYLKVRNKFWNKLIIG